MKRIVKLGIIILLIFLSGCENLFYERERENTNESNFDVLWETMRDRYSLFEYRGINWDSIRTIYRPLALQSETDLELYDVMAEMLNTLKDGHVNLRTPYDISRYQPYLEASANYSFDVLERNYLGDYRITGYLLNQVIDEVGYIHYRSFATPIQENELDFVLQRFEGLPGVIIDIRNNEGGNPANALKLASRIISERTKIYAYQSKSGPGPSDFTQMNEVFLDPAESTLKFMGRIAVLTNRKVYSAGSYFSAYMKAIPNAILIGDHTGGGCGVPAGHDLPNGWYFNFSSTIGFTVDGLNFEGGVPVDINVEMTDEDIANGRDPILERAITFIKTGT